MNALDLVRRLHEHRAWVNRKLLEAAFPLSEDSLKKALPIGQGSVWKSLVHLHAAEYVWLEALLGNGAALVRGDVPGNLPGNQLGQGGFGSLAELAEAWSPLEGRWRTYLAGLSEGALDEMVLKTSSSGQQSSTRRGDILLHVCTHAQYTTAQVINMLRQLGVASLPDTMLITMARQERA